MVEIAVFISAGFLCGVLNAIAGGGTFITLPVLIWAGVPPVAANATTTTTALPGYMASVWAYRARFGVEGQLSLWLVILLAAIGGILGGCLLVVTTADAFIGLVPWLLLTATLLFAFAPAILRRLSSGKGPGGARYRSAFLTLAATTYGGYFNGGLGIVLLSAFSLQGYRDLHGMNGLKNLLASVLSIGSVITFVGADLIEWDATLPMMTGNIGGAFIASRLVQRFECVEALRLLIIAIGFALSAAFFFL
ncbi:MAG: sulfite exporter TauE/SafE family protein [Pseudomonadota bacterium]